jgi:hypothetical protein
MLKDIKYIDELIGSDLPKDQYVIINSAWLTLMGIRCNGDLDLIVSNELWNSEFSNKDTELSFGLPGKHENRIRIHSQIGPYTQLDGVVDNTDIVLNKFIFIDNVKFVIPKYYFEYKTKRLMEMRSKIQAMKWYKHASFFRNYGENKVFKKYKKDYRDFKKVNEYFSSSLNKESSLSFIKDEEWGVENNQLNMLKQL